MVVFLILAFMMPSHHADEVNLVAGYLIDKQTTACNRYPTAPCCNVGAFDTAVMSINMVEAGTEYGIDPLIIAAIAWHESKLVEDAIGPNGRDAGLLQISPKWVPETHAELLHPSTNIWTGARVLAWWKSRPKFKDDYIAHYGGGVYLEMRHSAFQGWVLDQATKWRYKHSGGTL